MERIIDSTNFDEEKVITSYDANKVWAMIENGRKQFCKKTKVQELETNLLISGAMANKKIVIGSSKYSLSVPEIYNWDELRNILVMEYCDGVNLEFVLRNKTSYNFGVNILNELLKFFIENNLYWIDFAPRNILITDKKINFVDFEKGIGSYNDVKEYLRNHVYEEYGSFSFLEDRILTPNDVFDLEATESEYIHYMSDIGPKRIKAIAKLLGLNEKLSHRQYLQIVKMFIIAEEPQIIGNDYFFPRVMLEQILKDKNVNPESFDNYAKKILSINKQAGNPFIKDYKFEG